MKFEYLERSGSTRLILIFAGWSSEPSLYAGCKVEGWDTLVAYDFDDLSFDYHLLEGYDTVYLYAWSLGVAAASRMLRAEWLTHAFAVNGTECPADDNHGIPSAIFSATETNLTPRNLTKFRRRMVSDSSMLHLFGPEATQERVEQLRSQLRMFESISNNHSEETSPLPWDRAYIAASDRIFPPQSQNRFWSIHMARPDIVNVDGAHYMDMAEIVRTTIHDRNSVGQHFSRALSSYDSNAKAQHIIADHLCRLISERLMKSGNPSHKNARVLEIGTGSGYFSRRYAELLRPEHITYVDLYDLPKMNLAPDERYIRMDAEEFMALDETAIGQKYDYILSSSAIQWLANLPLFFSNAARVLHKGGLLACSTFLPGNLCQLDSVRPTPLLYTELTALRKMLECHYKNILCDDETLTLDFATPREALLHLRLTGVGGSAKGTSASIPMTRLLKALTPPCLTYRPAYLLGTVK